MLGDLVPTPLAAKVPEIIVLFWVVKILTTAGGEATSRSPKAPINESEVGGKAQPVWTDQVS